MPTPALSQCTFIPASQSFSSGIKPGSGVWDELGKLIHLHLHLGRQANRLRGSHSQAVSELDQAPESRAHERPRAATKPPRSLLSWAHSAPTGCRCRPWYPHSTNIQARLSLWVTSTWHCHGNPSLETSSGNRGLSPGATCVW